MSVIDTRSLSRAQRRKIETRERLIEAAGEIFATEGYQALTIKAITDHADLGYGTFYLHFADKDDIVWELVKLYIDSSEVVTREELQPYPSPLREYLSWIRFFQYMSLNRDRFLDLFGKNGSAKLLQRYHDYLAEVHEVNLHAGNYSTLIDISPEFMAQYITGAIIRLVIWWLQNDMHYTPLEMANSIFKAAFRQPPPTVPDSFNIESGSILEPPYSLKE